MKLPSYKLAVNRIQTLGFKPCLYFDTFEDCVPDLSMISAKHGCSLKVISGNKDAFEYDSKRKKIYMGLYKSEIKDKNYIIKTICLYFTHELAHHLQKEFTNYIDTHSIDLSILLKYERQAEKIAYYIYKKYFTHLRSYSLSHFNKYTSKKDIDFLKTAL